MSKFLMPSGNDRNRFVLEILHNPLRRQWSLQGFGMLRTYLDDEQRYRLHIWDPSRAYDEVSTIHDHPWDFTSEVISGEVTNRRYVETLHNLLNGASTFRHAEILCGEGGGIVGEVDTRTLLALPSETYKAGDAYYQRAAELHDTETTPGAVTVIRRTFHEDRDHANVYWLGGDWGTAEPRPATDAEVLSMTRLALGHWAPSEADW